MQRYAIARKGKKIFAKLQAKYLFNMPLKKGSILNKSCKEDFVFFANVLLSDWKN